MPAPPTFQDLSSSIQSMSCLRLSLVEGADSAATLGTQIFLSALSLVYGTGFIWALGRIFPSPH